MGAPVDHQTISALWIDDQIGALIDRLEGMGAFDETIFIFCSDHNVEPGKATCYDRGIRVPLLVSAPALFDGPHVCNALAQNIDLLPTMLSLCGIEPAEPCAFDGADLTGLMQGEAVSVHDDLYFEVGFTRAVRTDRWKYVALRFPADTLEEMAAGKLDEAPNHMVQWRQQHSHIALCNYPAYYEQDQLYDLEADPAEHHNLAGDPAYGEVLADMQDRMRGCIERLPHPFDLTRQEFLETVEFADLAAATKAVGTGFIPWWNQETGRSED
jgi:arylsulfatase A-like enzyme